MTRTAKRINGNDLTNKLHMNSINPRKCLEMKIKKNEMFQVFLVKYNET